MDIGMESAIGGHGDTTTGTVESDACTTESILEAIKMLGHSYKRPELPPARKVGRFERIMNKFGWYRQTEVIVIDMEQLWRAIRREHDPIPWIPGA